MKKVLIFCLILLCTLSVFAADVAAKVCIHLSYGDKGFYYSTNYSWEPLVSLSVSGDQTGGSFTWCPVDLRFSDFEYKVWFKPKDQWKFTVGAHVSTAFKEEVAFENLMVYGFVDYTGYDSKTASEDKYYANAAFGFGYKPYEFRDFSNASMFVSSSLNLINTKTGTFHIDNLTKLNIEENKTSLNYSLTETTYGLALEDWTPFYNKGAINGSFDFDESYYFTNWSNSYIKYETIVGVTPSFGLRYKYYTEADMQKETGLYGIAVAGNTENGIGLEGELELGRNGSEFIGKIIGSKDSFSYKVFIGFESDWSESFNLKPELYSKVNYNYEGYNLYLVSNYNNAYNVFGSADGVFFNPGVSFSVGACGLDIGATVGFDSQKNFKWSAQSQSSFTVNF